MAWERHTWSNCRPIWLGNQAQVVPLGACRLSQRRRLHPSWLRQQCRSDVSHCQVSRIVKLRGLWYGHARAWWLGGCSRPFWNELRNLRWLLAMYLRGMQEIQDQSVDLSNFPLRAFFRRTHRYKHGKYDCWKEYDRRCGAVDSILSTNYRAVIRCVQVPRPGDGDLPRL